MGTLIEPIISQRLLRSPYVILDTSVLSPQAISNTGGLHHLIEEIDERAHLSGLSDTLIEHIDKQYTVFEKFVEGSIRNSRLIVPEAQRKELRGRAYGLEQSVEALSKRLQNRVGVFYHRQARLFRTVADAPSVQQSQGYTDTWCNVEQLARWFPEADFTLPWKPGNGANVPGPVDRVLIAEWIASTNAGRSVILATYDHDFATFGQYAFEILTNRLLSYLETNMYASGQMKGASERADAAYLSRTGEHRIPKHMRVKTAS